MNNNFPHCYIPEKENPYPLCAGNGDDECEQSMIYAELKSPYDEEEIRVMEIREEVVEVWNRRTGEQSE